MIMEAFFIPDGYTQTAKIEARPEFIRKRIVTYRPALVDEYNAWRAEANSGDPKRKRKRL